jgi:hypothetical protein
VIGSFRTKTNQITYLNILKIIALISKAVILKICTSHNL